MSVTFERESGGHHWLGGGGYGPIFFFGPRIQMRNPFVTFVFKCNSNVYLMIIYM